MEDIDAALAKRALQLKVEVASYQSNSEGAIIDYIQNELENADGIIINPGALTHYGLSLRDALQDTGLPVIEVHLSNIHAREEWRSKSVISPISRGQIVGLGWRGFVAALELMVSMVSDEE